MLYLTFFYCFAVFVFLSYMCKTKIFKKHLKPNTDKTVRHDYLSMLFSLFCLKHLLLFSIREKLY